MESASLRLSEYSSYDHPSANNSSFSIKKNKMKKNSKYDNYFQSEFENAHNVMLSFTLLLGLNQSF